MKIYKGWVSQRPIYYAVKDSAVKCIDRLVKDEYVIVNTAIIPGEVRCLPEATWLEILAVTGITEEQMQRVFKEDPELRNSFAHPRPNKE